MSERRPSAKSLRALDFLNIFLADVRDEKRFPES